MNKYDFIKKDIIAKIEKNILRPEMRIMSRSEMMSYYHVSITTVCKALEDLKNDGYIEVHHGKGAFVANGTKKTAKKGRKVIALIVPEIVGDDVFCNTNTSKNYISTLVQVITLSSAKLDSDLVLYITDNNDHIIERNNIHNAIERGVDGIILLPCMSWGVNRQLIEVVKSNIPVVIVDRISSGVDCGFVSFDNYGGAFDATLYAIEKGIKDIHHITLLNCADDITLRKYGYTNAMLGEGLSPNLHHLDIPSYDYKGFYDTTYNYIIDNINLFNENSAVFTPNSIMLEAVYKALEDKGRLSNISFITFDTLLRHIGNANLVIDILYDIDAIAYMSLNMLIDKIEGTAELRNVLHDAIIYSNEKAALTNNGRYDPYLMPLDLTDMRR